jgi:hypothetical protein
MLLFYRLLNNTYIFPVFLSKNGYSAFPSLRRSFIQNEIAMKIERKKRSSRKENPIKEELIKIFEVLVD